MIVGSAKIERNAGPDVTASAPDAQSARTPFLVVTVGWNEPLVSNLCDRIEEHSDILFSHVITTTRDLLAFDRRRGRRGLYALRDHPAFAKPVADRELLASLERPDMLTVHNMILSDRVVRHLPEEEALAYATALTRALADAYKVLRPSVVVGSFDNLHAGISLAVARQLGIPWFALSFTAVPVGLTGVCTGLSPNTVFPVQEHSEETLRQLAESTLQGYVAGTAVAPAYVSANTLSMVVRRFPAHLRELGASLTRSVVGGFDKYTDYSLPWLCREYLRKRLNVVTRPNSWLCDTPPSTPYMFFGLHMQPESSIDVWAPFHANQFATVEAIARSMPPTHQLLVKLHISDADSYSRAHLRRLRRLPGVRLVSPFARSRAFIEGASLVVTTMGTMAMEAALLGKPVLMFGESKFSLMPSVSTAGAFRELPGQIREKLSEQPPIRESIVRGLMSYLALFAPGCDNDWGVRRTDVEIGNLVKQFDALRTIVWSSHETG